MDVLICVQEYKKLTGENEQEMKFRYIEKCRMLSTYGISFFALKVCHAMLVHY